MFTCHKRDIVTHIIKRDRIRSGVGVSVAGGTSDLEMSPPSNRPARYCLARCLTGSRAADLVGGSMTLECSAVTARDAT